MLARVTRADLAHADGVPSQADARRTPQAANGHAAVAPAGDGKASSRPEGKAKTQVSSASMLIGGSKRARLAPPPADQPSALRARPDSPPLDLSLGTFTRCLQAPARTLSESGIRNQWCSQSPRLLKPASRRPDVVLFCCGLRGFHSLITALAPRDPLPCMVRPPGRPCYLPTQPSCPESSQRRVAGEAVPRASDQHEGERHPCCQAGASLHSPLQSALCSVDRAHV